MKGINIPDKVFGIDSANLIVFAPLLVIIILIIISINLVFIPKYDELTAMQGNLTEIKDQTKILLDKIRYIQSIDQEELNKNSVSLASALLPQKNSYLLVDVIRRVVTKQGYQVDSFLINPGNVDNKTAKATTSKGVSKIPLKIILVGPKSAYLELVKSIERTLPVLSISNFKMTSVGSLSKLDMEVAAYYVEDSAQFDINKLSLADLTLKKEETDVITALSDYSIVEKGRDSEVDRSVLPFTKYKIRDPFSL